MTIFQFFRKKKTQIDIHHVDASRLYTLLLLALRSGALVTAFDNSLTHSSAVDYPRTLRLSHVAVPFHLAHCCFSQYQHANSESCFSPETLEHLLDPFGIHVQFKSVFAISVHPASRLASHISFVPSKIGNTLIIKTTCLALFHRNTHDRTFSMPPCPTVHWRDVTSSLLFTTQTWKWLGPQFSDIRLPHGVPDNWSSPHDDNNTITRHRHLFQRGHNSEPALFNFKRLSHCR